MTEESKGEDGAEPSKSEDPDEPKDEGVAEPTKDGEDPKLSDMIRDEGIDDGDHHVPGTVALTFIFLLSFAIYYFANWKALADVWHVR